jgi:RNA polymerase sigma factor (TIGR02999 family)
MVNDDIPQDRAGDEPDRTAPARTTGDVTLILSRIEQGEPHAAEQLLPLVYDELRKLAAARMAQEKPGQTLQATALVHEAYIRLVDTEKAQHWNSRGHFFGAAAEAIRRILVESARQKGRQRRGGQRQRCELAEDDLVAYPVSDEVLDLDAAICALSEVSGQAAELVKMRVFAGMTIDEVAQFLGMSPRNAKRMWAYARAWIGREVHQ